MSRFTLHSDESRFSRHQNDEPNGLPSQLKRFDQWVVTQDKKPVVPSKGWQKSVNQLPFTKAQRKAQEIGGTVAFCFTEGGPFVGFDLDDVKVDGQFTEEALEIVQRLDSYTEVSSSGTGLHVIAEGEKVDDRRSRDDLSEAGHLEVYDKRRYFVLTGDVYKGRISVEKGPTISRKLQEAISPKDPEIAQIAPQRLRTPLERSP